MADFDVKTVSRAAKNLLDNHDFTVLMSYVENMMAETLLNGAPEDADTNLRNYRAVAAIKQLAENLGRT